MRDVHPLPSDALEVSRLLLELIHVAHATRAEDEVGTLGGHGSPARVSPHAVRAAIHVYQHGERTVGELAAGLGISVGWASRVVSELETSGLIARTGDPADRRIVRISLTPGAIALVESAFRWRGDAIDTVLAEFGPSDREVIRAFLRRVVAALGGGSGMADDAGAGASAGESNAGEPNAGGPSARTDAAERTGTPRSTAPSRSHG